MLIVEIAQKNLLFCISEESKTSEKIKLFLKKAGINYNVFLLNSAEELSQKLSNLCVQSWTIMWFGGWTSFFRLLLSVIANSSIKIPIIWLYESKDLQYLLDSQEEGVSAFISCNDSENEMLAKIVGFRKVSNQIENFESALKEREKKVAQNEIILKQREEFLGICSHDLRAPLGLIQTGLSMILNEESRQQTIKPLYLELLNRAKRQASIAMNLVNDLLDVVSYENGLKPQYEIVELDNFLTELVRDFSLEASKKSIGLHYSNQASYLNILADPVRLRQLLQNLINNAIKFTKNGKNIYLNVESFKGRRKTDPPHPMVIISVKDEGQGIPPRELQKIFDKFSQIKEYSRNEGRGLGLTVAKQISSLHDGNVWVRSVEGEGSTFFVLFPHVIGVKRPTQNTQKNIRIIIVENSPDKRLLYFENLKKLGVEIIYVNDGPSAVARTYYEMPDALILGDNLTKMTIEEIYNIIKSNNEMAHVKVALASTENYSGTSLDYVFKLPINEDDFRKFISIKKAA